VIAIGVLFLAGVIMCDGLNQTDQGFVLGPCYLDHRPYEGRDRVWLEVN